MTSECEMNQPEGTGAERQARLRVLAQMREPFKSVPTEEIEREVAKAIADVRMEKGPLTGGQLRRHGAEEHRGDEVE